MEQKKETCARPGVCIIGEVYAANERYEKDTAEREDLLEGKNAVWEALCAGRQLDKLFFRQRIGIIGRTHHRPCAKAGSAGAGM